MIVVHIHNQDEIDTYKKDKLIQKYIDEGKHVYVLIYMDGCGPCNRVRPLWAEIERDHSQENPFHKDPRIVFVDIEKTWVDNNPTLKNLFSADTLNGYPTIRLFRKDLPTYEEYSMEERGFPTQTGILHFMRDHSNQYKEVKSGKSQWGGYMKKRKRATKRRATKKRATKKRATKRKGASRRRPRR